MEDIIVYLVFVAFALLSRFLSKKKNPAEGKSRPQNTQQGKSKRQPSFEELLREFTEGPQETKEPEPTQPTREYQTMEGQTYETQNYDTLYTNDEEARAIYEKSIKESEKLKTIDELVDYDKVKTKLDHFEAYDTDEKGTTYAERLRKELQKPDEIKKAIIYSEILNRKY